jgi:hypothetical protein
MTFASQSFASLGITSGTYVWTLETNDTMTAYSGPAATPLPSALPLFASGLGALGLLGWRRKTKAAAA